MTHSLPVRAPLPTKRLAALLLAAGMLAPDIAVHAAPPNKTAVRRPAPSKMVPIVRFKYAVDPKMPLAELLPRAPKVAARPRPNLIDDLEQVLEVSLEAPVEFDPQLRNLAKLTEEQLGEVFDELMRGKNKAMAHIAEGIARINHLNAKGTDYFMDVLLANRADLRGLPVVKGDACRLSKERGREFTRAVSLVQSAMPPGELHGHPFLPSTTGINDPVEEATKFWLQFRQSVLQDDKGEVQRQRSNPDDVLAARVAALMQVLAPASPAMRSRLVSYLGEIDHVDATRALARLVIFAPEAEVRGPALEVLRKRRADQYTPILLAGLRYPWPAVAHRAADAIVCLGRKDLVPRLVDLLDEPDPRAPMTMRRAGENVTVVRELVRINHHRNCLLCHPPAMTSDRQLDDLALVVHEMPVGAVAVPGLPIAPASQGYGMLSPDLLVRADATYFRQDFSAMQKVPDAAPWPTMQRFDYLVRTRVLDAAEAKIHGDMLAKEGSPYQDCVWMALRRLTGREAAANAQAWRTTLKLGTVSD